MMKFGTTWAELREPVRFGLQSAVGAVLAYLAAHAAGLPEISWAVMSALFVAHQNLDATVTAAGGRIGGTLAGTLVGLGTVLLLPGSDAVGWRLAFAALVMNGMTVLLPNTRFGVVAAAIIVLPSGNDVFNSAVNRGLAIGVGTLVGTAAALFVWPESAARRGERAAMRALSACHDLLKAEFGALMQEEKADVDDMHQRALAALRQANELANEARVRRKRSAGTRELVSATTQLWHTLILVDRLQKEHSGRNGMPRDDAVAKAVRCVREHACEVLSDAQARRNLALDDTEAAIDHATELMRATEASSALEPFAFALGQLAHDLKALDRALTKR